MQHKRVEKFRGYCPTQDKWETVEQVYFDVTKTGSNHYEYIPGHITCPFISFRKGTCELSKNCPVVKGEWTSENPNVFVALQFDSPEGKSRSVVHDVIKPVCSELGLNAFTVLEPEYNDGIYDNILKSISKSHIVIADLTYDNNGAYYEAGYAKGQGKIVIHTCSREWFKMEGVHFDVKGLNLILYENNEDFAEKLRKRIRETCER